MAGLVPPITSAVDVSLDAAMTGGSSMTQWVRNSGAGAITVTCTPLLISGTGLNTFSLPAGKYGCFTSNGTGVVKVRVFDV